MLNKIISFFALAVLLIAAPKFAAASHIAGGEITYECLGSNQYEINLNLYWDCTGGFDPGASATVTLTSSCGAPITLTVNQINVGGTDISQICGSITSSCSGGTFPGMMMNSYSGIVTLPPCADWTASWSTCCRNAAITNLLTPSSYGSYLETTLNSVAAPCNNSPYFTAQPIPYVCAGQPVTYSYGVVETDGDSLYYSLIAAMDAGGTPLTYAAGYSATSPIPGITIDPVTGLLSFTPPTVGNFVVVVLVEEFDSAGNLIGTIMRDIQFVVQACSNVVPDPTGGAISGLTGSAVQTGPYSIEMCAGNNFSFTASYTDPDATDILNYVTNILTALPGSTVTSSGTNPLILTFSWTAPASMAGVNCTYAVTIEDDNCPIPGQQTFAYYVNVLDATTTNPDITICGSQTANLSAYGGSIFTWSVVSGDPMTPGNFSCNPCANPVATPSVTTTYAVVSNLSGSCDNVDTVTVFIVPDFSYIITSSSTSSCLLQPIQLGVTALTPGGPGYTYSWSPATYLNSTTISNPIATITTPGLYTYVLDVISPSGCLKTDSVTISVIPAVTPLITAYSDTAFCVGGTATLGVNFGNGVPAVCGLSATGSCAATLPIDAGTGTSTASAYPTPFSGFWGDGHVQMLFTAAELNAMGFVGGKINALAFNVFTKMSTIPYNGFTIKMGCTSLSSLASFQPGLPTVYGPTNYTSTTGWNTFNFTTAYEWDGISNLIVETCYDNNVTWTNNDVVYKTLTAFNSTVMAYTDGSPGCNLPSTGTYTERPNIRFSVCAVASDPSDYTYQWTPASGGIANDTMQSTTATPTGMTTFTITVTDIAGGCQAVDSVQVDVINISTLTINPNGPHCVNGIMDTITTSVPVGTGTFSGPGITDATLGEFDPAVAGVGTHEIIYTVSSSCGSGADTTMVTVIPQPDATITPVGNQCATGASITLSAVSSGGVWTGIGITSASAGTFDPVTAGVGNHTITYTITTPCNAVDTVIISVTSQLDATITNVGPFCTAAPSLTLTAVDAGGTWSGPGITNASTGVFDPATAGAGTHVVTYSIVGLCGNTDTASIVVIPSPIITMSSNLTEGCEPTTISFTSTNNQPGGTCSWDFGNGNTSSACNPFETYIYAGLYDVTFTYANTIGCSSTITVPGMITIHSQPIANFISTPQSPTIVNPEIEFIDQSTGIIDSWHWDFGTSDTSLLSNPTYTYADTGVYTITMIVTNNNGCADTAVHSIYIGPVLVFYAPTGFTPDGNGLNDEFMVYGDGIDPGHFTMRIFNRWGELIYKSSSIYEGWNGKMLNFGELCAQGVYVWKVETRDYKGQNKQYIGHVTLTK